MVSVSERILEKSSASASIERPAHLRAAEGRRLRTADLVEAGIVALLLGALIVQLLSYPPVTAADDEGYPSYAQHLTRSLTLKDGHHRLPGYPFFVAALSGFAELPILELKRKAVQAQMVLAVLVIMAAWAVARAKLGRLPALIFLGIMAAPNYFVKWAIPVMTDFLFSIIWVPLALFLWHWLLRERGRWDLLWLVPIALTVAALQSIRANGATMVGMFAGAVTLAFLVERWRARTVRGGVDWRRAVLRTQHWPKLAGVLLVSVVILFGANRFDTGWREYNLTAFYYRVVMYMPPASDSLAERRIEAGREKFREIEGEPLERTRIVSWRKISGNEMMSFITPNDVKEVWLNRILAHPGAYAQTIWENILWQHFRLIRHVVPFFVDFSTLPMDQAYPPEDGSWSSNLFRATGLSEGRRPSTAERGLPPQVGLIGILLELAAGYGTLGLGIWHIGRRYLTLVVAMTAMVALQVVFLATFNSNDPRYMLPFAIPCYLAQAVGVAWLLRLFVVDGSKIRPGVATVVETRAAAR